MQQNRVLIAFGIAWLSALLLSWYVYKRTGAPEARNLVSVVAAARDLAIGKRIQAEDLRLLTLDRKDLPKGAFLKTAEVVDRAVATPISAGELLLNAKLAAKGSGEGLTALIEPGMRAVSVQVNEISGVSGFIQPGTRVDVLFTRVFPNGDAATTTILQNVKVIAYGRQYDPGAKPDPKETAKPTVATLLVSQDEAEKLVLAEQRGRLHFALRNGLDEDTFEASRPVKSVDLGIDDPVKPKPTPPAFAPIPAPVAATAAEAKAEKPASPAHIIRIYRGAKLTELLLK